MPNLLDLPDNVFHSHILVQLSADNIRNLRLVSKHLKKIIDTFAVERCYTDLKWRFKKGVFFSKFMRKSIEIKDFIDVKKLDVLKNPPDYLLRLKYLSIRHFDYSLIKIEDLNKFTALELLELICVKVDNPFELRLPRLECLTIVCDIEENLDYRELVVDTPKLRCLFVAVSFIDKGPRRLISDLSIKITNPKSIEFIRCSSEFDISKLGDLECLKRLEVIITAKNTLEPKTLDKFKNLKKLMIFLNIKYKTAIDPERFTIFYNDLRKISPDLLIFLNGVRIDNASEVINEELNSVEFQLKKYDKLEKNLDVCSVMYYNPLKELLPNKCLADLFERFTNIAEIVVYKTLKKSKEEFFKFAKRCSNLTKLTFQDASIDQEFCERLPEIESLSSLAITENTIDLNYDFAKRIRYLGNIAVDQKMFLVKDPYDMIDVLNLNELKHLRIFGIINKQLAILIAYKRSKDDFIIVDNPRCFNFTDKGYNLYDLFFNFKEDLHQVALNELKKLRIASKKQVRGRRR